VYELFLNGFQRPVRPGADNGYIRVGAITPALGSTRILVPFEVICGLHSEQKAPGAWRPRNFCDCQTIAPGF